MNTPNRKALALLPTLLLATTQLACSSSEGGGPAPHSGNGFFESANPTGVSNNDGPAGSEGAGGSGANASATASSTTGGTPPGNDNGGDGAESPERALEEADIVKIVGDRLYAMSRYGGIAVIDISDLDQLELLGRHKIEATPFEMYVKDGIVFALYQDYGEYVIDEDDGTAAWTQTSHVVVVDAKSPGNMTELSRFAVPGSISDSRIVGDILYVAAFENGYCWGCEADRPKTTLVSLDVSDPTNVAQVDELAFEDAEYAYSWRRSLAVNDERIYVAGPVWGADRPKGSTIQVIDISDPSGDLVEGASVEVAGQINSRWQMDEHEGVLRVISQPFDWDLSVPPKVETFTVSASDEVTPLAELSLTLPRPEQLQSVRFDGDRGYAITFERTDPLFTIDLSDPAAPVQAGMLEMPGWLYHMEPRGDRLLGLGFDQGNTDGALTVSVFDVSNLAEPVMLDRANFGGEWAWMVEDQDRIHKAFRLFDEAGLIVMPFSGWLEASEPTSELECVSGRWVSGVQLIDWQGDNVTARGVAETNAEARRGLLHEGHLLTVSDERVEAFDIGDRDAPKATSNVTLAQYVARTVPVGEQVARIGQNWYSDVTEIDVASLEDVATPRSSAGLAVEVGDTEACDTYRYLSDVFASDERLILLHTEYDYRGGDYEERLRISGIDVSDPTRPKALGSSVLEIAPGYGYYDYSLPGAGSTMVQAGDALVINHQKTEWLDSGPRSIESGVHVVDTRDPADAKSRYLELPSGLGVTGLIVDGSIVARSHYEASPTDPGKVRFFLDRIDVSDPDHPVRLPTLNTPGAVVALAGQRGFAIDYLSRVVEDVTFEECSSEHAKVVGFDVPENADYWTARGTCSAIVEVVTLFEMGETGVSVLGRQTLRHDEAVADVALGSDVMFATLRNSGYYYYDGLVGDCWGCFSIRAGAARVLTLGGLTSGDLEVGRLELDQGDYWYSNFIRASGDRALVSTGWRGELTVLDASNPAKPKLVREVALDGYVSDISMLGSIAVVSLGYDGVQTVDLRD